jgi:hypothetical protein
MNNEMLDPDFLPAAQWIRTFKADALAQNGPMITVGLQRGEEPVARVALRILPEVAAARNFFFLERHIKTLLWAYGGNRILLDAPAYLVSRLQRHYQNAPTGQFDSSLIGEKIFGSPLAVRYVPAQEIAEPASHGYPLGRHLDGCRIGFDLGGSDRKCAALIDGNVVFSEEIKWNPYFEKDPEYHFHGIMDSLQRAAAHLPRVDAIGGSAAGVYVKNEVRVASLFRGVGADDFEKHVRHIFKRVQAAWDNVPLVVINDGEVTALAGAMSLHENALLGVSLGTSTAAGYVTTDGHLTSWLNELAFVPVDYRADAPVDEWSGDTGCAVQYFSQQGVARLARVAGFSFAADMPLAEQLVQIQECMQGGSDAAARIYAAIGQAFGHTLAHWTDFYTLRHVLILGRVTSGTGGDLILEEARRCLEAVYPELASTMAFHIPDETMKRHGQAVAAASLPALV